MGVLPKYFIGASSKNGPEASVSSSGRIFRFLALVPISHGLSMAHGKEQLHVTFFPRVSVTHDDRHVQHDRHAPL